VIIKSYLGREQVVVSRFSVTRDAVAELPIDRGLMDGEAVVLRSNGYSAPHCWSGTQRRKRSARAVFSAHK
jgi:hypothetical protein